MQTKTTTVPQQPQVRRLLAETIHLRRDAVHLRRLGIHRWQILYFTYLAHAALGLPSHRSRERQTFLLTPYFLYLLAIGDLLMERYGGLFSLKKLARRLDAARREDRLFWFSADELLARGAVRAQLYALPRARKFPEVGDPCRLIAGASNAIDAIITNQPIEDALKQRARHAFTLAYNTVLGAALRERRLLDFSGPFPKPDEVWPYLHAKGRDFAAHWINCLLLASGRPPQEYGQIQALLSAFVHITVLDDDLRDCAFDFGQQPNIVLSVAKHRFPSEFIALERAVQRGERFRTIRGEHRLRAIAPGTLAHLVDVRAQIHRRLTSIPFFSWILRLQRALIVAKRTEDSLALLK